jgi:hypothetical protein
VESDRASSAVGIKFLSQSAERGYDPEERHHSEDQFHYLGKETVQPEAFHIGRLKLTPKPLDLFDVNGVRRMRVGCHLMILPVEPADRRTLKQRWCQRKDRLISSRRSGNPTAAAQKATAAEAFRPTNLERCEKCVEYEN